MQSATTDEQPALDDGRHYATRWVVRGHWRQQAHGPGRAQRRTQWIESYIKGPKGARWRHTPSYAPGADRPLTPKQPPVPTMNWIERAGPAPPT